MSRMLFLLIALRMTQGSWWHDDLDQPRRYIIDESRNQPVSGQGRVRLERSNIDRNRCVRISDRFGQDGLLADAKVARQHVRVSFKASNPALGVLKHDKMKRARRIAAFTLGNLTQHPHGLQCRWSDAP